MSTAGFISSDYQGDTSDSPSEKWEINENRNGWEQCSDNINASAKGCAYLGKGVGMFPGVACAAAYVTIGLSVDCATFQPCSNPCSSTGFPSSKRGAKAGMEFGRAATSMAFGAVGGILGFFTSPCTTNDKCAPFFNTLNERLVFNGDDALIDRVPAAPPRQTML